MELDIRETYKELKKSYIIVIHRETFKYTIVFHYFNLKLNLSIKGKKQYTIKH